MRVSRTAKSCGPGISTPMLTRVNASHCARTVATSPITGESTKEAVKTIARGMPDVSGVTVVTCLRAFIFARKATGATGARHSLLPLIRRGVVCNNSGVWRRGNIALRQSEEHSAEAIQLFWIASLALAMTGARCLTCENECQERCQTQFPSTPR
jgi:hypothetical protein